MLKYVNAYIHGFLYSPWTIDMLEIWSLIEIILLISK